jgi:pheromone shutdown protein TraB
MRFSPSDLCVCGLWAGGSVWAFFYLDTDVVTAAILGLIMAALLSLPFSLAGGALAGLIQAWRERDFSRTVPTPRVPRR